MQGLGIAKQREREREREGERETHTDTHTERIEYEYEILCDGSFALSTEREEPVDIVEGRTTLHSTVPLLPDAGTWLLPSAVPVGQWRIDGA